MRVATTIEGCEAGLSVVGHYPLVLRYRGHFYRKVQPVWVAPDAPISAYLYVECRGVPDPRSVCVRNGVPNRGGDPHG